MSEQYVLRWHYQEVTLLKCLSSFLESEILTDVTISVESENVRAHRLILAMCSVYFAQLFQNMGDTQHPVIVLHNVTTSDLKAVLSFIYRGQCVVTREQLPGLLSLAKLLKIQGLCDMKIPEKYIQTAPSKGITSTCSNQQYDTVTKVTNHDSNMGETGCYNSTPTKKISETLLDSCIKHADEDDIYHLPNLKRPKELSETCKCFLCGKYLSNQYNLRVHMETHEEAYHACQSCPHVSRSRDALRKHVSYRHPEEYITRKRKKQPDFT